MNRFNFISGARIPWQWRKFKIGDRVRSRRDGLVGEVSSSEINSIDGKIIMVSWDRKNNDQFWKIDDLERE